MGCFHIFGYHEHSCTSFCVNVFSFLLGMYLGVELLDLYGGITGNSMFSILRNGQIVFQTSLYHFTFPSAMYENTYIVFSHTLWLILANTCYCLFFFLLCLVFTVACRLSSPMARRILAPRRGMEPESPALEGRFLTMNHQEVPVLFFF